MLFMWKGSVNFYSYINANNGATALNNSPATHASVEHVLYVRTQRSTDMTESLRRFLSQETVKNK